MREYFRIGVERNSRRSGSGPTPPPPEAQDGSLCGPGLLGRMLLGNCFSVMIHPILAHSLRRARLLSLYGQGAQVPAGCWPWAPLCQRGHLGGPRWRARRPPAHRGYASGASDTRPWGGSAVQRSSAACLWSGSFQQTEIDPSSVSSTKPCIMVERKGEGRERTGTAHRCHVPSHRHPAGSKPAKKSAKLKVSL